MVLIGRYHLRRPLRTVLGLLLMVAIAAGVVFMAQLWPAFRYHHTASASCARWDVHVNGPLTRVDLDSVARAIGPASQVQVANRGALRRLWSARRVLEQPGDLYALSSSDPQVPSGPPDPGLAWAPDAVLVSGSMAGPGAAGIDWVTARKLGVHRGDTVGYSQVYVAPSGESREYEGSARITAVLATTAELRGLVVRSPADLDKTLAGTVGIVATDVFVRTGHPALVAERIGSLPESVNWSVSTKQVSQQIAEKRADEAGARAYGSVGLIVACVLLFVVMMRESIARMARRRSGLAVLYSLGADSSGLLVVHLVEQAALVALVSGLGYLLGVELLVGQVGLYPPESAFTLLRAVWLACTLALCAMCAVSVSGRLSDSALLQSASEWGE